MTIEVVIRRPQPSEYGSLRALIENVANETIVGVLITNQEWVSDLWVFREYRRQGVGSRLLAQGEAEIAARGHSTSRLRVVRSNAVAVQFYLGQGWQVAREFAHEKYHHAMLEMAKSLPEQVQ